MTTGTVDITELTTTRTPTERIEWIRRARLADQAGLSRLLDSAEQAAHTAPNASCVVAESCDSLAAETGLVAIRARAAYLRARVSAERGELDAALRLIELARAYWMESGDLLAAMRNDLGRMHVLDDLGRHREAVAAGTALLAALDDLAPSDESIELRGRLRATAWNNLGASYCLVGNHERALDAYTAAESAYEALGLPNERAQPLANRGIALVAQGRPRDALAVLGVARAIFDGIGDRLWKAKCDGVIAQAHQQLGELMDALRALDGARDALEDLDAHAEVARIRLAAAGVYLSAGLFGEASAEALVAAEQSKRLGLRHDHATAAFVLALAYLGADRVDEAEGELARAAASFATLGDRQYEARVQLARAELAAQQGDTEGAFASARTAAQRLAAGGWRIAETWAWVRASDFAPSNVAAALLTEAESLLNELRVPDLRYACALRRARLDLQDGDTEGAEMAFRRAVGDADVIGANLPDATFAMSTRSDKLDAHDGLLEILVARGRPDDVAEALQVGDDAKAKTLLGMISGTVGAGAADAPAALRSLDQRRADLSAVYNAMAAASTPAEVEPLQRHARDLENEVAALRLLDGTARARVRSSVPDHTSATFGGHDTTTIAYHVVGDDIVVFVLGHDGVRTHRLLDRRSEVQRTLKRLGTQWTRFRIASAVAQRRSGPLVETARDELQSLHRLLLEPVLADGIDGSDLVVVPHRELHQVPFHALYDGAHYALERWTISVAPTVRRLMSDAGSGAATRAGVLVLAVPDDRAPSITEEAMAVAGTTPSSRVLVGEAATVEALCSSLPGPAFVHFACHGLYRPQNPMFSALRLGDRWFTAAEVLELELGGAVVALSACESGRAGDQTAEPVGLAWAFLAAGASSVLVSQWIVDDDTTATVMADFYTQVAAGRTTASALRHAQLTAAEHSPHPFQWAPFVHVTSPSAHLDRTMT